ncbi:MAG: type II secretion system protein [candidate division Zixibacteria bacterium]
MIKLSNKQKGFTLIEVMAGMVVLSVGLILLLPMMVTSMQANDMARGSTEASMYIKDKMEELKNMNPPVSGADSVGTVQRAWNVASINPNLWQIDVSVSWNDRNDRPHTNTITSYMSTR